MFLTRVSIILSTLYFASAKIYQRCELARELRNFDMPEDEIPTWVCIAKYESNFDTAAMNPGSGDHGLFQISQLYWCSPPGDGYGCNSPCFKFRDDDIADDLQCIRRIHNEHKRISGDGFSAWVVYPLYCKQDNANYIQDCFDEGFEFKPEISSNITDNEISTEDGDEYGDGYDFPALPTFSKKQDEKKGEYGDGYQFPKLPHFNNFELAENSTESLLERASKSHNLPFSRTSIHDVVQSEVKKYRLPKFPYSKTSIHHSIPTKEIKVPFSKESIHHFILVGNESEHEAPLKTSPVEPGDLLPETTERETLPTMIINNTTALPPSTFTTISQYSTIARPTTLQPSTQFSLSQLSTTTFKPYTTTKASKTSKTDLSTTTRGSTVATAANGTPKLFTAFTSIASSTIRTTTVADFAGASSTFVPIRLTFRPSTTTFKPLFVTSFEKNNSISTRRPFDFDQSKTRATQRLYTFKFSSTSTESATKKYTFANRFSNSSITTTSRPFGRQVTFAPNSFFSWLFNSQTLPPLVPPPRPPGSFPRPTVDERPRPPSSLERPGVLQAPLRPEFELTTKRPFAMRPRPSRPAQRPFRRPPGHPPRRPHSPGAGSMTFIHINDNVTPKKQNEENLQATTRSSRISDKEATSVSPLGRSNGLREIKKDEVEIKLDKDVVFVRTKYGYRLFRTAK